MRHATHYECWAEWPSSIRAEIHHVPRPYPRVHRYRTIFSNCLRFAVERELPATLPLDKVVWTPPVTDDEVDFSIRTRPQAGNEAVSGDNRRCRHDRPHQPPYNARDGDRA
jgi:hypothetical protein